MNRFLPSRERQIPQKSEKSEGIQALWQRAIRENRENASFPGKMQKLCHSGGK